MRSGVATALSAVGGDAPQVDDQAPGQAPQVLHTEVKARRTTGHPGCARTSPRQSVQTGFRFSRNDVMPSTAPGSWLAEAITSTATP